MSILNCNQEKISQLLFCYSLYVLNNSGNIEKSMDDEIGYPYYYHNFMSLGELISDVLGMLGYADIDACGMRLNKKAMDLSLSSPPPLSSVSFNENDLIGLNKIIFSDSNHMNLTTYLEYLISDNGNILYEYSDILYNLIAFDNAVPIIFPSYIKNALCIS